MRYQRIDIRKRLARLDGKPFLLWEKTIGGGRNAFEGVISGGKSGWKKEETFDRTVSRRGYFLYTLLLAGKKGMEKQLRGRERFLRSGDTPPAPQEGNEILPAARN